MTSAHPPSSVTKNRPARVNFDPSVLRSTAGTSVRAYVRPRIPSVSETRHRPCLSPSRILRRHVHELFGSIPARYVGLVDRFSVLEADGGQVITAVRLICARVSVCRLMPGAVFVCCWISSVLVFEGGVVVLLQCQGSLFSDGAFCSFLCWSRCDGTSTLNGGANVTGTWCSGTHFRKLGRARAENARFNLERGYLDRQSSPLLPRPKCRAQVAGIRRTRPRIGRFGRWCGHPARQRSRHRQIHAAVANHLQNNKPQSAVRFRRESAQQVAPLAAQRWNLCPRKCEPACRNPHGGDSDGRRSSLCLSSCRPASNLSNASVPVYVLLSFCIAVSMRQFLLVC